MARSFASGESEEMRTEFRAHSDVVRHRHLVACRAVVHASRSGSFDMANWRRVVGRQRHAEAALEELRERVLGVGHEEPRVRDRRDGDADLGRRSQLEHGRCSSRPWEMPSAKSQAVASTGPVWKSTSASRAPDVFTKSFLADDRPSWLGRAARNRHRHAIEQASRRWRGGRRDDSARTRRKILISTQHGAPRRSASALAAAREAVHGAGRRSVVRGADVAVDGERVRPRLVVDGVDAPHVGQQRRERGVRGRVAARGEERAEEVRDHLPEVRDGPLGPPDVVDARELDCEDDVQVPRRRVPLGAAPPVDGDARLEYDSEPPPCGALDDVAGAPRTPWEKKMLPRPQRREGLK